MRKRTWLALAGTMFFGASAALAGELVYFANGTFLKIESHEIKGDMVQVQLDPSSKLAFPARLIDRIEGNQGVVWGSGSTAVAKNQALPGTQLPPQSDGLQRGVNPGSKKNWTPEPGSGLHATQKSVQTGFGMSGNAGEKVYLDGVILGSATTGPDGAKMIGNRVIVNPDIQTSIGRKPVRFQAQNPQVIPQPEPPPAQVGEVVTAPPHQPVDDEPPAMPDDPPAEQPEDPGDAGDAGDGGEGN